MYFIFSFEFIIKKNPFSTDRKLHAIIIQSETLEYCIIAVIYNVGNVISGEIILFDEQKDFQLESFR